jgi:starch phosphorylase
VAQVWRDGYDPQVHIQRSRELAEVLDLIESGFFSFGEPERFRPILDSLRGHDPT